MMHGKPIDTEVLAHSPLFSEIRTEDLEVIAIVMRRRKIEAGEYLFVAGAEGEALAMLVEGELVVKTTEQDEYVVNPFEVVGEMTCIDPARRSANVVAREDSTVVLLDRKTLMMLRESSPSAYTAIVRSIAERLTLRLQWVNDQLQQRYSGASTITDIPRAPEQGGQSTPFEGRVDFRQLHSLGDFSASELEVLATEARFRRYEPGAVICREGAEADRCYIVAEGEIEIRKNVAGHTVVLGAAEKGALLGQSALVCSTKRTATLQARDAVVTLELDRDVFDRLLGRNTPVGIRFQELIARSAVRQLRSANERLGQIPRFEEIVASGSSAEVDAGNNGGFEREDTVKRFYNQVLARSGISEGELASVSFA